MSVIAGIHGREILDSRGNPTVEADVLLEDGVVGRGVSPSGASTGSYEAIELRDGNTDRYRGKGVLEAVNSINGEIADVLIGRDVTEQTALDRLMIELDGTPNKKRLGANAILSVSIAMAKAGSNAKKQSLYRYLGGIMARQLPVPMMNIVNGGMHANNSLDIQEFMIMPVGASSFNEALQWGANIFQCLRLNLKKLGYSTAVGDEGGFAPEIRSNKECLDLIVAAIQEEGFEPGNDITLALDIAATELLDDKIYRLDGEGLKYTSQQFIEYQENLCSNYPISSIEDGLSEDDWEGWSEMTKRMGQRIQLVGDDLFVTDTARIAKGVELKAGNSVLIKMNQIGTITETLEAVEAAQKAGMQAIVSHRSGETEDTSIADLAVATNCGQIKAGSLSRTDRVAKYNQLLRIEEELGSYGKY